MHNNLLNILSESNKDIDNQKLMDYISGKLSADQKHEVEKWMAENNFHDEAIEGLQQAGSEKSKQALEHLNKQLHLTLQQRKRTREKHKLPVNLWTYIAVILVLIIAVIVYLVIRMNINK